MASTAARLRPLARLRPTLHQRPTTTVLSLRSPFPNHGASQVRSHSDDAQASPVAPPSSVSASEVSHFTRLASSWWDPHGPSRLLHLMNPLRHDFINKCLRVSESTSSYRPVPSSTPSYLDIGCGGGIFASSAARLPSTSTVTAIDPTPSCIQVAKQHARTDPALTPEKLTYLNCAIENLPANVQPVDILTVFEVLEHISSPSSFLETCVSHLKPGGWLIGSTIARHPLSYITTKLIAEAPVIGVVPRGTHDWNQYINPEELEAWFTAKTAGEWGEFHSQGVVYLPGVGWKMVNGTEKYGNYFFGIQKLSRVDGK